MPFSEAAASIRAHTTILNQAQAAGSAVPATAPPDSDFVRFAQKIGPKSFVLGKNLCDLHKKSRSGRPFRAGSAPLPPPQPGDAGPGWPLNRRSVRRPVSLARLRLKLRAVPHLDPDGMELPRLAALWLEGKNVLAMHLFAHQLNGLLQGVLPLGNSGCVRRWRP